MIKRFLRTCVGLLLAANALNAEAPAGGSPEKPEPANPFLVESSLPFQYPRFDLVRESHYLPAYEQGMAEDLHEIADIADSSEEPTFENTIVAMERSGQLLDRVARVFGGINATDTTPGLQAIEKTMAPKLSAHSDAIRLNPRLFRRIETLCICWKNTTRTLSGRAPAWATTRRRSCASSTASWPRSKPPSPRMCSRR
jgi:peptidyl-dipeptidase Dcp